MGWTSQALCSCAGIWGKWTNRSFSTVGTILTDSVFPLALQRLPAWKHNCLGTYTAILKAEMRHPQTKAGCCMCTTITTTLWPIPSTCFTQCFYLQALWDWPQYLPCVSKVPQPTNSHSWRLLLIGRHLWRALTTFYNLSSASLQPSSLLISCRCPFPIMSQNQMDHLTLILFLLHLLPLWWLGYLHSQT